MTITVSLQVYYQLLSYWKALSTNPKYKITQQRANEKFFNLRRYMRREIPSKVTMFGICRYKDLGQRFNRMNQPMIRKLRQALYADESKTQWSISFFYSEVIDKLYYSRIKMSRLIRCSITDTNRIISETINQYLKQNIL
jgi:hypothetical protein